MHISTPAEKAPTVTAGGPPWYRELDRAHWFVLIVASLGWLFDTMDQQLFNLARVAAVSELLGLPASDPQVKVWAGYSTSIFLMGWATGGIFFGVLGDRWGRTRTTSFPSVPWTTSAVGSRTRWRKPG